jgi:hypothetical protein
MRGGVKGGTVGQDALVIPAGYQPAETLNMPVVSNGAYGQVSVAGYLTPTVGNTAQIKLDGLMWTVDTL